MKFTTLDAPPLAVLREHIPEVADDVEAVHQALAAARTARARWLSVLDQVPTALRGSAEQVGVDLAAARAADVESVAQGTEPTAYAELVAARPRLAGVFYALDGFAQRLVQDWNAHGHEQVKPETVQGLRARRDAAAVECRKAARDALAAAPGHSSGIDRAAVQAAYEPLARMNAAAQTWREWSALVGWSAWRRPLTNGPAWDRQHYFGQWPTTATGRAWYSDPITRARALSDDGLRAQVEQLDNQPPQVVDLSRREAARR